MPLFVKNPVVIEAIEFDGTQGNRDELEKWMGRHDCQNVNWFFDGEKYRNFMIMTLEGAMVATVGDWIIKGVKDEFYPCKPDIFRDSYSPVPDGDS